MTNKPKSKGVNGSVSASTIPPTIVKQELIDNSTLPVLTSIGITRNNGDFYSFVLKTQGDKVINYELSKPGPKVNAATDARIEFNKRFLMQDIE